MTSDVLVCPECSQPMKSGGLVLSKREDDGRRWTTRREAMSMTVAR
jgi:uncharacterized protein YbaR (Trm112 family)